MLPCAHGVVRNYQQQSQGFPLRACLILAAIDFDERPGTDQRIKCVILEPYVTAKTVPQIELMQQGNGDFTPSVINARKSLAADPKSVARVLQLSKAEAARRQYREAVATSTQGLAFAPKNADLYLERGHRELGLREFNAAMNDREHATRLAPEMLDAYYHLGLAHSFLGEFDEATASFNGARALARSNDSLIDCSNWLYVSLRTVF